MPPKDTKKIQRSITQKSSTNGEFDEEPMSPRCVSLSLLLKGDSPGPGDWLFLTVFNGNIIVDSKWHNNHILDSDALVIDLKVPYYQSIAAHNPLMFLLRVTGGKGSKDPDPLLNADNRAGATVDLFPFLLGEEEIKINVPFINIASGINMNCSVEVIATSRGINEHGKIPLMLTMISAHCLPFVREGTVFISAIGLNDIHDPVAVNFGMSLSTLEATKLVWASASNGGFAANTAYRVPNEDQFIPGDLEPQCTDTCSSYYWNSMTRVLVDANALRSRLTAPFLVELAGVPRFGKVDVRGRYMAFVDAGVLLEPGQYGVTVSAKLLYYNETDLPEGVGALLELPPASAKLSTREADTLTDEYGHSAYILLRFDLFDPLIMKVKMSSLFQVIGFPTLNAPVAPMDELCIEMLPEEYELDVRRIRKEGGALSVHKELSGLACKGMVQMNQSIKRTAANKLLLRIRSMLKQFSPGECSYLDMQDTITAQHAACRRAVTSSFEPQPPQLRITSRIAAARSRVTGDMRISDEHTENNLNAAPRHPRILLSKTLRCLERRNDTEARSHLLSGLSSQPRNRYLLWIYGGTEYNKAEFREKAIAAFHIAVKGDPSDGTTGVIGWAALHALHHHNKNIYAAFVSVRKMRKSYELSSDWKKWLQRWIVTSGEEELLWTPSTVDTNNPLLIAAAFFLCLRCYSFSERLLRCAVENCATRGSRFGLKAKFTVDIFYIRSASLLLQRQLDKSLELIEQGIKRFGPSAIMSQIRAICLTCIRGWDGDCENALVETDRQGENSCPLLLLQAALGGMKSNPTVALQRAARAHKIAPSAQSALIIARIYMNICEEILAERWAAVAVKIEPLLADGWAVLALIAMYSQDIDKARTMLRTAKQVGPISSDINDQLMKIMKIVHIETLPDTLVKNICFCDYY